MDNNKYRAKEQYMVQIYEVNGQTIVEVTNLNNLNKKLSLCGKMADELLQQNNGFHKMLK